MPRAFEEDRDSIARSRAASQVRSAIQEAVFMDGGGVPGDSWATRTAQRTRGGADGDPDKPGGLDGVVPKAGLADYSWDELKRIARAIAAASCHAEGLAIARIYNLVDDDLKLGGDTKEVVLEDGTRAGVRILGFRHDRLAGGAGRAGISFEFADVPTKHRMNPYWTNEGGWQESEMRDWLNSVFLGRLPQALASNIVQVEKRTSYRDRDSLGQAFHVAGTFDRLWLLSMPEVYGRLSAYRRILPSYLSPYAAVYDAEGVQYQLYADNGVSVANYGFCRKHGADSWWWLRSPRANDSLGFRCVVDGGDWYYVIANYGLGVSPGFCF